MRKPNIPGSARRWLGILTIFAFLAVLGALVAVNLSGGDDESAEVVATTAPPTTEAVASTTVAPMPPPEHVAVLTEGARTSMDLAIDPEGNAVFLVGGEDGELTVGRCLDRACTDVEFNQLPTEFAEGIRGLPNMTQALFVTPDGYPIFGVRGSDGFVGTITCLDPLCMESAHGRLFDTCGTERIGADREGIPIAAVRAVVGGPAELHMTRCTDAGCSNPITAVIGDAGLEAPEALGIATDAENRPVIVASDRMSGALEFFACDDPRCSSWSVEELEIPDTALPLYGDVTRTAFGTDGRPYVAANQGTLRMLTCSEPVCSQGLAVSGVTVASDWDYGLAIRSDGRPVLAYSARNRSLDEYRMEVAVCDDPTCSSGTIAVIAEGHGAFSTDIALDGDIPVIGYVFRYENTAYVYRCTDPLCEDGAVSVSRWDQSTLEARDPVGPPPGRFTKVAEYEAPVPPFSGGAFGLVSLRDGPVVTAQSCGDLAEGWDCVPLIGLVSAEGVWSWKTVNLGETGLHFMAASTIDGDRAVIAGEKCGEDWICEPRVWITDFETWTEAEVQGCEAGCDAWIEQVVPFAGGMAAIGVMDGYSAAWFSSDGLTWVPAEIEGVLEDDPWLFGASAFGDGLMLYGEACPEELDWECIAALWSSPDGAVWTRFETEGLDGADLDALVAGPDRAVLFGDRCPEESRLCTSMSWTSLDGVSWTGTPIGDLPGGSIRAVAFRDGFALYMRLFDKYFSEDYPVLAVSEDLATWEVFEVDEAERLGINALWTDGERVLLAGSDDDGPAIWEWIP